MQCLLRRLVLASLLAGACRAENTAPILADDVAASVDKPAIDVALPDASTPADVVDAAPPMDAADDVAPSTDAAPDDVALDATAEVVTDAPADVAPDRPRDAGRVCVCPALPASCTETPLDTPAFSPESALLTQLMSVIACASTSLHIALYETTWDCVPNAIAARLAAAPGLSVQLVYDAETCPLAAGHLMCPLSALEGNARVTLVPDGRTALMHHKFVVADNARVWVGSANSSQQSYCFDANDAVVIGESAIVSAYEGEFQRMFRDRMFGPIEPETTPPTAGRYTVYFSPRSPVSSAGRWFTDMVSAIGAATTSVDFVIASWTRTEVSDAMIAARARGVAVRGIVDALYIGAEPALALRRAGIPVRVGDVHSKLMMLDGQTVITGSANWSAASWANNENSLWIRDAAAATAYRAYFERQYMVATTPPAP